VTSRWQMQGDGANRANRRWRHRQWRCLECHCNSLTFGGLSDTGGTITDRNGTKIRRNDAVGSHPRRTGEDFSRGARTDCSRARPSPTTAIPLRPLGGFNPRFSPHRDSVAEQRSISIQPHTCQGKAGKRTSSLLMLVCCGSGSNVATRRVLTQCEQLRTLTPSLSSLLSAHPARTLRG
jgi:hypothetical protein